MPDSSHATNYTSGIDILPNGGRSLARGVQVALRMKNLRLHSSGVFGNVYRGTLLSPAPRREIALKKTWPEIDKEHCRVNLELNILLGLSREKHKNIVQILYTFRSITPDKKENVSYRKHRKTLQICESMVFDYMPTTLSALVKKLGGRHPNYLDIKLYTWQLFNGLMFLFHSHICHRDIKPQNLLVEPAIGNLKIADFGSAKVMKRCVQSTSYQVTLYICCLTLRKSCSDCPKKHATGTFLVSAQCQLGVGKGREKRSESAEQAA
uniref:Protein kinase domain-containing protein n=1 Tax=Ascaris lumbricoides TaxID=6252 RepID=A0A9J2PQ03_ASCLU